MLKHIVQCCGQINLKNSKKHVNTAKFDPPTTIPITTHPPLNQTTTLQHVKSPYLVVISICPHINTQDIKLEYT